MCFRPAEVGGIEHRCPACGTNNLPEATMCANCFAPMEPLGAEAMNAATAAPSAAPAPAAPAAPKAPSAPAAPSAPVPPSAPVVPAPVALTNSDTDAIVFSESAETKREEPGLGDIISF